MTQEELNRIKKEMQQALAIQRSFWDGFEEAISEFSLKLLKPVHDDKMEEMRRNDNRPKKIH